MISFLPRRSHAYIQASFQALTDALLPVLPQSGRSTHIHTHGNQHSAITSSNLYPTKQSISTHTNPQHQQNPCHNQRNSRDHFQYDNQPDMGVHDYIIYALDHYIAVQQQLYRTVISLSTPTALMMDHAATQLANTHRVQPLLQSLFPNGGMFTHLTRHDRIRTLAALENGEIDLYPLPTPFHNNDGLVKHVTDALNSLALFGFYSEWPAYGSTRLYPPSYRRLEFFPWAWQQVGYPGVSLGYRDFRGFLLTMDRIEGEQ